MTGQEPDAAGWYADPGGSGIARFWDGEAWTQRTGAPERIGTPPEGLLPCAVCGRTPTASVEIVQSTGLLIFLSYRSFKGAYCRDCGVAIANDAIAYSSVAGWWSVVSVVANPVFLALSFRSLRNLERLEAPVGEPAAPPRTAVVPALDRWTTRIGLLLGAVLLVAIAAIVVIGMVG